MRSRWQRRRIHLGTRKIPKEVSRNVRRFVYCGGALPSDILLGSRQKFGMIELLFTPTGRIYTQGNNKYVLTIYGNDTYRLITNETVTYIGLDVKKFDIKKHLIK